MSGPEKISGLPAAIAVDRSANRIPIVQAGVTNEISPEDLDVIKRGSLTISAANVLNAYTVPVELVAAPGAGYFLEPFTAFHLPTYNTTPYDTNTDAQIIIAGATQAALLSQTNALASTGNNAKTYTPLNGVINPATDKNLVENAAMLWQPIGGNPLNGDSPITVYFSYMIRKK